MTISITTLNTQQNGRNVLLTVEISSLTPSGVILSVIKLNVVAPPIFGSSL
jgi:hypothetical protein